MLVFQNPTGNLCYLNAILVVWSHLGLSEVPAAWWHALAPDVPVEPGTDTETETTPDPGVADAVEVRVSAATRQLVYYLFTQLGDAAVLARTRPIMPVTKSGTPGWRRLQAHAPVPFAEVRQQDAGEALMYCLEAVDQVLGAAAVSNPFTTRRWVHRTFSCTRCPGPGPTPDPVVEQSPEERCDVWTLTAPSPDVAVPAALSLPDLVARALAFDGTTVAVTCPRCRHPSRDVTQEYVVTQWPKYMWVLLPIYDLETRARRLQTIEVPPQWQAPTAGRPVFTLRGAVLHHGTSVDSGHYTAWVYDPAADRWAHVDDGRLQAVSSGHDAMFEKFMGPGGIVSQHAYVVLYENASQAWAAPA